MVVGSKTHCVTWALLQTLEGIARIADAASLIKGPALGFHLAQLVSAELDS